MTTEFICNFSANDPDFPFTIGKTYSAQDGIKGFNHLSTHILADNGKSVKVETSSMIIEGKNKWYVKDTRSYSKYMSYASFEPL